MSDKVRTVVVVTSVLLSCCASANPSSTEPPFTLSQVGPDIWAAISNPKSKTPASANTGFVIGDDSVLVVDTTESMDADGRFEKEPAQQLLAAIRKLTSLPVRYVINTHHHFDHTGANDVFAQTGAAVVAHRNVRIWIHDENLRLFGKDITSRQRVFIEGLRAPAITYRDAVDVYLGSRQVHIRSAVGHSGSDSVVIIPDEKVIFTGDLFWRNMLPNLMDASTASWIETLDTLVANTGATFVPGHGDVGNAGDVAEFREYLAALRRMVSAARTTGKSGDAIADMVVPELRHRFGRWEGFDYLARPNVLETMAELDGTKRLPSAAEIQ